MNKNARNNLQKREHDKETETVWDSKSHIYMHFECVFSIVFVAMIAYVPEKCFKTSEQPLIQ